MNGIQTTVVGLLLSLLISCGRAGYTSTPDHSPGAVEVVAPGDWNDVDAAVWAVAGRVEAAVVSSSASSDLWRHELLSINDERIVLETTREQGHEDRLRLRADVGFHGDRARAAALVRAVARRLHDLKGVEVAPLRD